MQYDALKHLTFFSLIGKDEAQYLSPLVEDFGDAEK
jgi:hypothetical protein